jgi:hypothetical protein
MVPLPSFGALAGAFTGAAGPVLACEARLWNGPLGNGFPRASSLDHLVGAGEESGRDRETEGVSGFEVHHELKPGGKQASPSRSG